ncbi:MAG: DEAD/DEAH box helicase [Phycisphaerae bacterium]
MPAKTAIATEKKNRPGTKATKAAKPPKLSRLIQPADLSLEEWQIALRRQYGQEQNFALRNIGDQKIFSDFEITNPTSRGVYRVAIRGEQLGDNFCSCPDFTTNTLGTCKHIEFTLQQLRQQAAGAAALKQGYNPPYSSVYLRYGAQREVRFRAGEDCPPALKKLAANYFDAQGGLLPEALLAFGQFLSAAAAIPHDLRCYNDALVFIAEKRDALEREAILAKAFPQGPNSPAMDHLVKVPLYAYQREGALFAARAGRCLIGDEMGLGKTIQAIAAVEIMAKHFGVQRVLIICPTSLKHQWAREIEKFAKRTTQVIGGMRTQREQGFATETFYKITNYDTVRRDMDLIEKWSPDMVILDEAQRIKNWNTIAARCVKQIKSPYAIVLTGTPLENRLEELVSVVQFVDRHRLGPTFQFLHQHQIHDLETGRVVGYQNLDLIGRTLAPILIRRKKDAVLKDLPGRLDKNFFVSMTAEQLNHHEENRDLVGRIVKRWRRTHYLSEADRQRLMIALQNMRMSCDSTYLLDHQTDFGYKADELATLLEELFERPGEKVVIFSQWLRMHELLQRRMEGRPWEHVLFHGGVPGKQRGALVDRFREDDRCRAFLATDAGGVGLNLQHAASVVVNVDLPWNPAVLEQRIGRVHRLGQKRPVQVINFVAKGTIEEGMLSVLKFKKSLFSGILDNGESAVMLGGSRLTKFIETVEQTTGAIPPATVEEPVDLSDGPSLTTAALSDATSGESTDFKPAATESLVVGSSASPATGNGDSSAGGVGAGNPWAGLLQVGLNILEQLAAQQSPRAQAGTSQVPSHSRTAGISIIHRDERTGESYMKLPVPSPEVLEQALGAIGAILEKFNTRQ